MGRPRGGRRSRDDSVAVGALLVAGEFHEALQHRVDLCPGLDERSGRSLRRALHGMLSRCHLLLSLLCCSVGAVMDLVNPDGTTLWCDSDGRLDLAAVAEKDPALSKILSEGLLVEVLSWKIMEEQPTACSLIAQALNKGHQAALKT